MYDLSGALWCIWWLILRVLIPQRSNQKLVVYLVGPYGAYDDLNCRYWSIPTDSRNSTATIWYILWPWRPNNSLRAWHPLDVTYITLLLSFAMGHFMMHIIAHFDNIDHRNIRYPKFNRINRAHVVAVASIQRFHQVQRPAVIKST